MRKKLTCIDISKLLELKKILLEEKFLKISTTFFLIFDPVCISIFNNYISKEVSELYLLLRFVMMFFALFNLFLFTSNEFITFCCNPSVEKDLNNLRNLDIEKYKDASNIFKKIFFTHVKYLCLIILCVICLYKGTSIIFNSDYIVSSLCIILLNILIGLISIFIDKKSKSINISFSNLIAIIK